MKIKIWAILSLILINLCLCPQVFATRLQLVAAENFYGYIAEQLGGANVRVTSILNNPSQDPHLFSATPRTARAIASADIIVYNGINYDPWMEKLLYAKTGNPKIIVVADLVGKKAGDNPHIWYDPKTMPIYAKALTDIFIELNPANKDYYMQRLAEFNKSYQPLTAKITQLKQRYQDTPVIATEPVFNYMADALGFKMYGQAFQLSVMNDTTPSASQTRDFENRLRDHAVRVLIYNSQVNDPVTQHMQSVATNAKIPTVGVTETQPPNKTYVQWMLNQLADIEKALQ